MLHVSSGHSLFFDGTKSHQVLAKVPKRLWIPAAAHGFVVFQNALRKSGTTELNVAGDRQFRQFMCKPVNLTTPVRVQQFRQGNLPMVEI